MRRGLLIAAVLALLAPAARSGAQTVFAGDPIDPATGLAYCILPGAPLLYPGADGRYGTADDVIDPDVTGDVDLVVRTAAVLSSAVIPAPAPGVAAAPTGVAGGQLGGGSPAPFFLVFSDGAAVPAAGNALLGAELDQRRALVVAYADLDGDGWIGPTAHSTASEIQVRRQEALTFAGRAMAEFSGGIASGHLGLTLGLPASVGGLGIVVGGGAATGRTPNLYDDGPWAATLLPYMIPLSQGSVVGGEATGPVDPVGLVDLELSGSAVYLPAPNHPTLGTPFAIPLDGSSPSVDLVRSVSGPIAGAGFARPVDPATYVAAWQHVLRPIVGADGGREIVEPLQEAAVDGTLDVVIFPADLMGNAADPPPGGAAIALEVGPALHIAAPDADGDPRRETIVFDSPRAVLLTLAANAADGSDALLATCDGSACGALPLTVTGGTAGVPAIDLVTARFRSVGTPGRGLLSLTLVAQTGATVVDAGQAVRVTLTDAAGIVYERAFPAGSLRAARQGGLRARAAGAALSLRQASGRLRLSLRDAGLTLTPGSAPVTARLEIGSSAWERSGTCVSPRPAVRRCRN